MFNWHDTLGQISCPDQQVKCLNEILLNIFSNFIPNSHITVKPRQAPWITQSIKNFLRKKNRAYRCFVRSGQPGERLEGILGMISQGAKMIEDAKQKYLMKIGQTLSNLNTGQKMY